MNLLDKFAAIEETRDGLLTEGINPTDVVVEEVLSPTESMIGGKRTIMGGTNNYLGLTFDEACIAAGQRALAESGTGTTGSRMANGNYASHALLEQELADFYGYPYAMIFSTGYAANIGTMAALVGSGDAIMLDGDAHASLFDGGKLSGATVYRFKHNDADSLDKRLNRLGDVASRTLVIVEGLYSILGDRAPLKELAEVTKKHGAYLFVDEAHSLGVLGEQGRGLIEETGVEADFIVGTFSKSLGSTGGFCVSPHKALTLFRYASRPYMFTASPCPSVVATTRAALAQLKARPELRETLWRNANKLYNGLSQLGFQLGPEPSPVVAVRMDSRERALAMWQRLLDDGVYLNLILPPAAPDGSALLRCSVSAGHSDAQIDKIIEAFRALPRETD
ncbi:MAG: aminotransferase class I/II-fold pyridoxal phosphate-dependent enzyme [Gammaproteobacteria bacterium]|nr:aminotransferase class I/II-fold pyridoxal phosphate-dependent enzyme [Gammaproteobacteria bacterium]